jgi:hypothetical protein
VFEKKRRFHGIVCGILEQWNQLLAWEIDITIFWAREQETKQHVPDSVVLCLGAEQAKEYALAPTFI